MGLCVGGILLTFFFLCFLHGDLDRPSLCTPYALPLISAMLYFLCCLYEGQTMLGRPEEGIEHDISLVANVLSYGFS